MTGAPYAVPMAAHGQPPRYQQIAADLRARIGSGEFAPGSLLPSEAKLKERYGAAQATIRHAIAVLRDEGLAEPEQGVGVWARKPPEPGPSEYDVVMGRLDEIAAEVRRLGQRMSDAEQALREQQ